MTAVVDLTSGTVTGDIEIAATPEAVFRALTTSEEMCSWWGSDDTYHIFNWKGDVRPGGQWSCEARSAATVAGRDAATVRGEFITVDPPRVLEHTWCPSWENFFATTVRYTLEPTVKGTRVSVVHTGFLGRNDSARGHADGWNRVLGWLAKRFEAQGS